MTTTAPVHITSNARATVGTGRAVHRAAIYRTEHNGRTRDDVSVSCGADSRAGGSRTYRVADDAPITCRSC